MTVKIQSTCSATENVKYDYGKLLSSINTAYITTAVH